MPSKPKNRKYILGLDIGGTKCAVVLGDEEARIHGRMSFPTPWAGDTSRSWNGFSTTSAKSSGEKACGPLPSGKAGISCGGPLDSRKGLILSPPNLPGWDKVPIVRWLEKRLHCPVRLENDANAGAVAEWKFGAGRGCRNLVFLTFGTGLGAGLILDGRLYRGTNDMAGEAGHLRLAPAGPRGYGKKGSFEGFCSGGGMGRMAVMIGLVSAKALCEAAHRGNPGALRIVKTTGKFLGAGLALLIDLLNPQRIIIGGIYTRHEKLFPVRGAQGRPPRGVGAFPIRLPDPALALGR